MNQTISEDELLISAASREKVQRVKGASRSVGNARQSHQARAWTSGGNVD